MKGRGGGGGWGRLTPDGWGWDDAMRYRKRAGFKGRRPGALGPPSPDQEGLRNSTLRGSPRQKAPFTLPGPRGSQAGTSAPHQSLRRVTRCRDSQRLPPTHHHHLHLPLARVGSPLKGTIGVSFSGTAGENQRSFAEPRFSNSPGFQPPRPGGNAPFAANAFIGTRQKGI